MFETINTTIEENGILVVTLDRPEALNALNQQILNELKDVITASYDDDAVKGIIITGAGDKAFVAGADIKEISQINELNSRKFAENGQEIFSLIENHSKPVIAAINGFALGGGCELAMACHIRIAVDKARFGQPEANLGLIPGYGGTQRLTQLVGKGKALELMMTCEMVDANQARQIGLVNHVVENHEELIPKCKEIMNKILTKAPHAVGMIIRSVNARYQDGQDGYLIEANSFSSCTSTLDFKEGVSAFIEKRSPQFNGN